MKRSLNTFVCLALLLLPAALAGAESITIPFTDDFSGARLSDAWSVDATAEASVRVADGVLQINAPANTYAHIERALNADGFRVSGLFRPEPAITWTPSLFLYWDTGNYCQLGLVAENVYYVLEVVDGVISEYRPNPIGASGQHLAIELGDNVIRYVAGADGKNWTTLKYTVRPKGVMAGKPALLIVGKGHSMPETFPAADLDNDYQTPGGMTRSVIDDIRVVRLEADRREVIQADLTVGLQGPDELGIEIIAAPGDPTFEEIARHYPAMQDPREAIGDKDGHLEFVVMADASLLTFDPPMVTGDPDHRKAVHTWFELGEPAVRFGSGGAPVDVSPKRLMEGYLPIVLATWEYDGLTCEQTLFGQGHGLKADDRLFAYVRLRISNPTSQRRTVPVVCRHDHLGEMSELAKWEMTVEPMSASSVCLKVPYVDAATGTTRLSPTAYQEKLDEVAGYWRSLLGEGMRIHTPEQRVNEAVRAWLAFNFIDVDERGNGVYRPHDGSGFYEHIYGYSAALYCHALDMYGYHDDSARYLESLCTYITPEGLFTMNFGLPDTGVLLFAMSEHYQFTRDKEWLRKVAPDMLRMCNYVIRTRAEHMARQSKDSITYGMIKFRPYCDDPVPTYYYVTDCTLVIGMEAAAAALDDIGVKEVDAIGKEAKRYRQDILRSMDRAVINHVGMEMLPLYAENQGMLKKTNYNANGYYGLCAGIFLENEFLGPYDRFTEIVFNALRNRGGLVLQMCRFDDWGPGGIDHAYTYGYWLDCLKRGEVEHAIMGLYASMAYGMSRTTYGGVEVTGLYSGKNMHTLPHLYSGTQQLRLLRNMLLREEGDALILGQAIPRHWLTPGQEVRVDDAPTKFGKLSYSIRVDEAGDMLVSLDPPLVRAPKSIALHLRHPQEAPIKAVTLDDDDFKGFDNSVITLRRLDGPAVIKVRY